MKSKLKKKVINATALVLSAPMRAYYKAKSLKADVKRGHVLYKQGYGKYADSALEVAKKGKKFGKEH